MHILYIQQILNYPEGSGNCRTYETAVAYAAHGHKVTVLTSRAELPPQFSEKKNRHGYWTLHRDGICIIIVDADYAHIMGFVKRVWAFCLFWLKAYKVGKTLSNIEVVLAYSPPLSVGYLGKILARRHRVPLALEVADVWPDVPIGMRIIKNRILIAALERWAASIYRSAKLLLPYSEDMKTQLLRYELDEEKIQVIHNGVNLRDWPQSSPLIRQEGIIRFIYTGTLGIANGLEQIIDAAALLKGWDIPPIQFILIGNGNREDALKEYVQLRDVQNVFFYPWMDRIQLRSWLSSAHIGISSFAPYPVLEANGATKFFDYLANGLPVLTNYQGWQARYLLRYECGLAAPQNDLEAFCRNIQHVTKDSIHRNKMSKNARICAEIEFDRNHLTNSSLSKIGLLVKAGPSVSSKPIIGK